MGRLLWIVLALVGAALLFLLARGKTGAPFGMTGDQFARVVYLGAFGLLAAAALLGSGIGLRGAARSAAIWLLAAAALVGGYQYRYELQDVASRLTAGLVPGSPLSVTGDGRTTVALERLADGHFAVKAQVNGADAWMILDTGATSTVLTAQAARAAGFDPDTLSYTVPIMTANGPARAASVVADELRVGAITRRNIRLFVAQPGMLEQSLLGMNFISTLSGLDMRGDRLTLID